ncbi:tigger transposable element-derived protein 4-like [Parasteatoda tepidariorum]|uniref:tigger transposable element-derived protein 4-like n=1 Tax=Parasteatoda tepidariorum TaxID=114398 RepID=UPI0039BD1EA6
MDYDANKNAWMTTAIFTKWLKKLDNVMKRQKRKILLFIDQCPAHPPDTNFLENVKVQFFLANYTSVLQPLDLGVIKNLKLQYRKQLVQLAIQSIAEPNPKKITVFQAMNMISLAWSQVTTTTIKNFFKKARFVHRTTDDNGGEDVSDDDTIILGEQ